MVNDCGRAQTSGCVIVGGTAYSWLLLALESRYFFILFFLRAVLNRAVPEEEAKAKKTAQGRAFNRA